MEQIVNFVKENKYDEAIKELKDLELNNNVKFKKYDFLEWVFLNFNENDKRTYDFFTYFEKHHIQEYKDYLNEYVFPFIGNINGFEFFNNYGIFGENAINYIHKIPSNAFSIEYAKENYFAEPLCHWSVSFSNVHHTELNYIKFTFEYLFEFLKDDTKVLGIIAWSPFILKDERIYNIVKKDTFIHLIKAFPTAYFYLNKDYQHDKDIIKTTIEYFTPNINSFIESENSFDEFIEKLTQEKPFYSPCFDVTLEDSPRDLLLLLYFNYCTFCK